MQSDFSDELVILGNGFDLSSGMKSKYGDYFKSREEISSEIEDIWKLFKTTYYEDDSNFLQILNELGKSNETHEIDKDKRDFYNFFYETVFKLRTLYGFSFWEIPNIIETNDKTLWSDVERGILEYLKLFNNQYIDVKETIDSAVNNIVEWNKADFNDFRIINDKKKLFELHMILASFFATEKEKLDIDKREKTSILDILKKWDSFQSFFADELNRFEKQFLAYIKLVSENKKYKENRKLLFKDIVSGGKECYDSKKYKCKVLSFNYTDYNDLVNSDVVNIHGSVNTENIIFGIDSIFSNPENASDYKNKAIDLKPFTKTYRLLELDSDDAGDSVLNSDIKVIKFFGHSLSHADYSYFQSIFDYYDIYSNNIKLIFYFALRDDDQVEEQRIMKRKRSQISKVYALMEDYGKTMDNADHGKNLLHKLIMEGRLSIKRAKLPDELNQSNN